MIFNARHWLTPLLLILLLLISCSDLRKPVLCDHIPELLFLEDTKVTQGIITLGDYEEDDLLEIVPGHTYKLGNKTMKMPCFDFGIWKNDCIYSKEFEDMKYCGG